MLQPAAPGMGAVYFMLGTPGSDAKKKKNKSIVTEEDEGLAARDFTWAS